MEQPQQIASVSDGQSLGYLIDTAGWGTVMLHAGAYNALRHILPGQWPAIFDGTSTDDHTAGFLAAVEQSKLSGQPLLLPGKRWNIRGGAEVIEHPCIIGNARDKTVLSVDTEGMEVGSVALRNIGGAWRHLQVRERTGNKARAILLQLSSSTERNAVGGSPEFTGYTNLMDVWVFGGLIAVDIGNVFNVRLEGCRIGEAALGLNVTPVHQQGIDSGYSNAIVLHGCEIADNDQPINVQSPKGVNSLSFSGGSIERGTITGVISGVRGLSFWGVYLEQFSGVPALAVVGCSSVYAKFDHGAGRSDLVVGTNTEIVVNGWSSGVSRLLGGDGTQKVTLINSYLPAEGNSPPESFATFSATQSVYNGVSYLNHAAAQSWAVDDMTYLPAMTPNFTRGNSKIIVPADGADFTIEAPVNRIFGQPYEAPRGALLKFTVKNRTTSALGRATWSNAYRMAPWTQPAPGCSRSIVFEFDGYAWIEQGRTVSDIPN